MLSNSYLAMLALGGPPAGAPPEDQKKAMFMQVGMMVFFGIIFYVMLIRPQQKQKKAHQALLSAVKTGDKVVTNSGIHGMIANVKEQTVLLKVADNVKIEIDKAAITAIDAASQQV